MDRVRPIETRYKGHRFRSRLEARWAVFFGEMGIKYEYELEGYKLPSGAAYLPDFYLPEIEVFVEVKPHERFAFADLKKCVEFAHEGDHNLLLITGTPTSETMFLVNRATVRPIYEFTDESTEELPEEELTPFFLDTQRDWAAVKFGVTPRSQAWTLLFAHLPPNNEAELMHSLATAKAARFEHGEKG